MKEVTGNLWTYPADCIVITTNGTVKKNGDCVMGRGCAYEATQRYPDIAKVLGNVIAKYGNHVQPLRTHPPMIFSFPVKHNWWEQADLTLIERSAHELDTRTAVFSLQTIVIPRPGCGNGRLKWEQVRSVLEPILDDRFHVITF